MVKITIEEIKKNYRYDHTAAHRGYVSRKSSGEVSRYEGRFGKGYTIDTPRWDTTNYCNREYWVEK